MMVQLFDQPDPERMFHENYAFHSSTSTAMKNHFQTFALSAKKAFSLDSTSLVVEIGCNDGIMLQNMIEARVPCLGVEPSENVANLAREKGIEVLSEFFDSVLADSIREKYGSADLVFSANVMCHIPDAHEVFKGVEKLLTNRGVFIFEDPYLGAIIEKTSFDQIYDEHVFLFSALSVQFLAAQHDLELIDVEEQETHGGSMRYSLGKKGQHLVSSRVSEQIAKERDLGLDLKETYQSFSAKVDKIGSDLIALLTKLKSEGKKVVAYGATSKSTTVTNYFGITPSLVSSIYDTTVAKHNTFSPGVGIPVRPYEEFQESDPDYVLLFAWNHAKEIMEKEKDFMIDGRKWITYIPHVSVV